MPERLSGNKVPAVLMVSGSGPQNRDEELMDHRPFAVIADYLARNGIASLRYDDRGIRTINRKFPHRHNLYAKGRCQEWHRFLAHY